MWPSPLNSASPQASNGNKMYSSGNAHAHHHPARPPSRYHPPRVLIPPASSGSSSPDSLYHHHSHSNNHWSRHNTHSGHHNHHHHHSNSPPSSRDRYDYHRYHHEPSPPPTHHRHQQHYSNHGGGYRKPGIMDDRFYRHSTSSGNLSPTHSNEFYHSRSSPNFHSHVNNNSYHGNQSFDASRNHHHKPLKSGKNQMTSPGVAMATAATSGVSTSTSGCTCKKSLCLKLYCQCFASSNKCDPSKCKCQSCHNTVLHESYIQEARKVILDRNPCAFQDKFTDSESLLSHGKVLEKKIQKREKTQKSAAIKEEERQGHTGERKEEENLKLGHKHRNSKFHQNESFASQDSANQDCTNDKSSYSRVHTAAKDVKLDHDIIQKKQDDSSRTNNVSNRKVDTCERNVTPERNTSNDKALQKYDHDEDIKAHDKNGQDKMAIMAALAMTELCAGKVKPIVVEQEDDGEQKQQKQEKSTTSPDTLCAGESNRLSSPSIDSDELKQKHGFKRNDKRKREHDGVNSETESFRNKRSRRPTSTLSKTSLKATKSQFSDKDEYIDRTRSDSTLIPVVSSTCSPSSNDQLSSPIYKKSHEVTPHSRNSSPISTMPPHIRHEYSSNYYQSAHPRYTNTPSNRRTDHHLLQSPPSYSRHFFPSRPMSSPVGKMMDPESSSSNNSCHFVTTPSPAKNNSPHTSKLSNASGLPKALSFRKICSKCGKTRGEHGELGFGNKCVYQDCGRCGAGVQMHVKAGVPMGFFCKLTIENGATPGASEAYEKKIQELARLAELKKESEKQASPQVSL